ncbi:MAG TPA: redox-regulated ATPase YchF [candidate division Zixibacteria bacterium]
MKVGIVGLPLVGKTTIFNALTGGKAKIGDFALGPKNPNIGVVKVPDERLYKIAQLYQPKKVTPTEVEYIDVGGLIEEEKKKGSEGQFYASLRETDQLAQVVREFENENVVHIHGQIDPKRDIKDFDCDLVLLDLDLVEKRISRLEKNLKVGRKEDKEEFELLARFKESLEGGIPLRKLKLTQVEEKLTRGYGFLSLKPMLVLLNIGENQIGDSARIEREMRSCIEDEKVDVCLVCGKLEMELSQLEEKDKESLRGELGIKEKALDKMTHNSYKLLDLVSFFTANQNEVKAWPIKSGSTALKAAGAVHSDMEKGFIKAEIISYGKLLEFGSTARAREKGELKLEGKDYIVQDGDVILFRFNL